MIGIEWAPFAGAIVGLIVGLTGVGGGALMAPILLVFFGIDLITVIATDLLFATITKLFASGIHHKNQYVDWQVTKRLWLGSLPATIIVIYLIHKGLVSNNSDWITFVLGCLILISGLSLLFGSKVQKFRRTQRILAPERFKKYQGIFTNLSGFILGGIVSATSIGAGALGAIFLRALYPLRMTPKVLVATDTTHAIPVSLLAGLGYLSLGEGNLYLLALLLSGSIPAVFLGCRLFRHLNADIIKSLLGAALIFSSFKLLTL